MRQHQLYWARVKFNLGQSTPTEAPPRGGAQVQGVWSQDVTPPDRPPPAYIDVTSTYHHSIFEHCTKSDQRECIESLLGLQGVNGRLLQQQQQQQHAYS